MNACSLFEAGEVNFQTHVSLTYDLLGSEHLSVAIAATFTCAYALFLCFIWQLARDLVVSLFAT